LTNTISRALYEEIDYSIDDIDSAVGAKVALSDDKVDVLMGRMRYPSLSMSVACLVRFSLFFSLPAWGRYSHGIEGAFSTQGAKTVIPAKVTGGVISPLGEK
jgi:Cys-Gly metallodipeptidase DUG1